MNIALGAINNIASKGFCKAVAELIEWLIELWIEAAILLCESHCKFCTKFNLRHIELFFRIDVLVCFIPCCVFLEKKILICMYHNLLSCSPSLNSFFSSSLHKKTKKRKELILADLFPNASCMPIIFDNLNLKYQLARMNTTNTSTISKRRIYFSPYYVLAIFSMF